ncbi:MAG: hypothetical protein AB7P17_00320 [Nitrospirales bacterium]|nr:hypothetical protein [Nitrospirales bacterium]
MKVFVRVSQTQWAEFQRLQTILGVEPDQLVDQALKALNWIVKEKQQGRIVMGFQDHPPTIHPMDLTTWDDIRVDDDVESKPLSQFPQLIAKEIRGLVHEGRFEEALEAADVEKRLDRSDRSSGLPDSKASHDLHRAQSAMILEAAKVMAEEGEPAIAVKLVKEVRKLKRL